jgi:hypothetical protein
MGPGGAGPRFAGRAAVGAVLFEVEGVFLQAALRLELGLPGAGDIRCKGGERKGRKGQEWDIRFHGVVMIERMSGMQVTVNP